MQGLPKKTLPFNDALVPWKRRTTEMMIQPGLATTFNDALVPWKRRIPVRRAGSSGVS
jgi:hypothetical protein